MTINFSYKFKAKHLNKINFFPYILTISVFYKQKK